MQEVCELLKDMKPGTTQFYTQPDHAANPFRDLASDMALATKRTTVNKKDDRGQEPRPPLRERKKRETHNGMGKCAFVDALYVEGGHTRSEILALTMAAFPSGDPEKVNGMVQVRPHYVRKAGKTPKWLKEPKASQAAEASA